MHYSQIWCFGKTKLMLKWWNAYEYKPKDANVDTPRVQLTKPTYILSRFTLKWLNQGVPFHITVKAVYPVLPNGPLARYVKSRVAHASRIPWTIFPLTSDFLWSRWRGKRSRHSRRMHSTKFYISGKRPIATINWVVDDLDFPLLYRIWTMRERSPSVRRRWLPLTETRAT